MRDDDTGAAFAHPGDRAVPDGVRPLDRILLRDHLREVEIGAFEVERGVRQRLAFDVAVEVAPIEAGDDVDRILSYDRLVEAIDAELAAGRLALLETLAEGVAARILGEPQARRVFLRIRKLDRGPGELGVEIVRDRSQAAGPAPAPALRPRVAVLADGADLAAVLAGEGPLLLVAPPAPAPRAATPESQARVDLLAADQGAWLLAAQDPRLAVAATRTEIDWALRRGRPVVWAPARLALDSGWAGLAPGERAERLARLLAGEAEG